MSNENDYYEIRKGLLKFTGPVTKRNPSDERWYDAFTKMNMPEIGKVYKPSEVNMADRNGILL